MAVVYSYREISVILHFYLIYIETNLQRFEKTVTIRCLDYRPLYAMNEWITFAEGKKKSTLNIDI